MALWRFMEAGMSSVSDSADLILVRHGETNWKVEKRCQGSRDESRLTAKGIEQATELARALEKSAAQALISSGQARSVQTATIIAERLKLPVMVDPRLGEMAQGAWEGLLFPDIERQDGAIYKQVIAHP